MKRYLIILILGAVFTLPGYSQQDPAFSQYMFNGLYLNPAYAGSHDYISASIVSRHQWTDFEGAPRTALLGVDGRIKNEHMGLGFLASNDELGVVSNSEFYAVYSYYIHLSQHTRLSFGLKAGAANYCERLDELIYWDHDKLFDGGYQSSWYPKFGFGMYLYRHNFYAGIAIPTILSYDRHFDFSLDMEESSFFRRHYFFTTGYVLPLSSDVVLKPFGLLKYSPGAPMQADFNLALLYKERFWLGLGYRSNTALTAMVEIQINHNIRLGYSYDFLHSDLYKYAGGTHEIMLGLDFGGNLRKFKSVRYF